jgi:hypothetical protein
VAEPYIYKMPVFDLGSHDADVPPQEKNLEHILQNRIWCL